MKNEAKGCLEQHLVDRAKLGTAVASDVWFDQAERNLESLATIVNNDANGATNLAWLAMHNIAKGLAALAGFAWRARRTARSWIS